MSGIPETLLKVRDYMAGASNYVAETCESLTRISDDIKNGFLPCSPDTRERIGKMCDAGYGEYFINAHKGLATGEPIDSDCLAVLQRFGLADSHGKVA